MSQCWTPLQASQTQPRFWCCRIPQRRHWCTTHECVGAQILWNSLRHMLLQLLCLRKMSLSPHHDGLHPCQSSMRRCRPNHLSHLTFLHNQKLHCQHPRLTMLSCHFPTMMRHHRGSIKNQENLGYQLNKIHQKTFHRKCRRHPHWFLRQQPMKTFHLHPSFDETPSIKAAQAPETPTIPPVATRWRSGTLHLENPVSKRWRSDTLHPETPVPTTAPPQLRRRFRGKQPDPSEVSVNRPRLAPAQVMSTALAKSCDWSLGVDE